MHISKRAAALDYIKEIWRNSEGPFENILRIGSYLLSIMGISGWLLLALDKYLSYSYQMGIEDLGRWLDQQLGLGPGDSIERQHVDAIPQLLEGLSSSAARDENMTKVAFLGGLFSLVRYGKLLASLIWKMVIFLISAFGLTKLGDMYKQTAEGKFFGEMSDLQMGAGMMEGMFGDALSGAPKDPTLDPANYGPQGYIGPQ